MSESRPVRLQLSRRKGFDLQASSHRRNGLGAVNVARPSGYGNPFIVGEFPALAYSRYTTSRVETADEAVSLYRRLCIENFAKYDDCVDRLLKLRGKNLACWCKPGAACHADVLLEFANAPICEAV